MFIDIIKEDAKRGKVIIYSDMDGVLCEYGAGEKGLIMSNEKGFYLSKRPLFSMLRKLEELSHIENVEVGIMSNCYYLEQKEDKIKWLEKYCPFIKKENINIIVLTNEVYTKETKDFLKGERLLSITSGSNKKWYLIEDNHDIIKCTNKLVEGSGRHFSELID